MALYVLVRFNMQRSSCHVLIVGNREQTLLASLSSRGSVPPLLFVGIASCVYVAIILDDVHSQYSDHKTRGAAIMYAYTVTYGQLRKHGSAEDKFISSVKEGEMYYVYERYSYIAL